MEENIFVPVEISARHIHLSLADADILFGKNYQFEVLKELSQKGESAFKETVDIEVQGVTIKRVRVVGPTREATQLELTLADSYFLKTDIPFRLSGDLAGSRSFRIVGPAGVVEAKEGMIIAKRHIHLSPKDAKLYGLKNGDVTAVQINGERETVFRQVAVRVKKNFQTMVHIDIDEANAAGLKSCGRGKLMIS